MNFFYTYVLLSLKDHKLYIGHTSNLINRYQEHQNGEVKSTKDRRPIKLIFFEGYLNLYDSIRRERYFKTNKGKRTLRLMLKEYFDNMM